MTRIFRTGTVILFLLLALDSAFARNEIVIPAGTKITVQLNYENHQTKTSLDGKVVWPVKIGLSTAIPTGATVKASIFDQYNETDRHRRVPVEVMQLLTITIGDKTYDVETDVVQLQIATVETSFTLSSDLKIEK